MLHQAPEAQQMREERQAEGPDDAELAAIAGESRDAFAELYERHYDCILNYTFGCVLNAAVAEELTANTFLRALRHIGRFRGTGSFRSWLLGIAVNEVRMHLRGRRRRPEVALAEVHLERITFDSRPDMVAEEKEQKLLEFARVHQAVLGLGEKYRDVISLRFFQQLSIDEIAEVLGKRASTVRSLISRGVGKLRRVLSPLKEE